MARKLEWVASMSLSVEIEKDKKMPGKNILIQTVNWSKVQTSRFSGNSDGVAAIEFALIAPLLILLFFGTMEVSTAVAVNRKVSRVSSTVADLVTQRADLSNAELDDIMKSASFVMEPYDHPVEIIVSQIKIEGGNATVDESRAFNATPLAKGSLYNVPAAIKIDGTYLIAAKVSVMHNPMVGNFTYKRREAGQAGRLEKDTSGIPMEEEIFLRPRKQHSINFE